MRAGDFYMLSSRHLLRYYCDPENPYSKIWINVGGRILNEMMQLYNLQSGIVIKQMNCRKTFDSIYEECARMDENNKPEIYRNVFKLLVRILDQLTGDAACDMMAPSSYKIRDFMDSSIQAGRHCQQVFLQQILHHLLHLDGLGHFAEAVHHSEED